MNELYFSPDSVVFDATGQFDGSRQGQKSEKQRRFLQQIRKHLENLFGKHEVELLYKIVDGQVTFSDIARKRICHRAQPSRDFDRLIEFARKRHIRSTAQKMIDLTHDHGGCILNPWTTEQVVSGYAVGIDGLETRFGGRPKVALAADDINSKFSAISNSNNPLYLGSWRSDFDYVFEIVRVFDDPDEATDFGVAQRQQCVFNIHDAQEIWLTDSGDHVKRAA